MKILARLNLYCYFHISINHFCGPNPGALASSFIEMEADISISTKNPVQVWLSSLLHCFNAGGMSSQFLHLYLQIVRYLAWWKSIVLVVIRPGTSCIKGKHFCKYSGF